jgi:hypothetical protein
MLIPSISEAWSPTWAAQSKFFQILVSHSHFFIRIFPRPINGHRRSPLILNIWLAWLWLFLDLKSDSWLAFYIFPSVFIWKNIKLIFIYWYYIIWTDSMSSPYDDVVLLLLIHHWTCYCYNVAAAASSYTTIIVFCSLSAQRLSILSSNDCDI